MISLTLPYPPTANNLFKNTGRGRARTAGYDFWIALSKAEIMRQRPGSIAGGYHLKLTVERPDNRARDIDNLIKPVSDLLKKAGVISDDSKAASVLAEWDLGKPSRKAVVHVSLWPPFTAREAVVPRDAQTADDKPGMNEPPFQNPAAPFSRRQLSNQTEGSQ